jgi:hypothetical protein
VKPYLDKALVEKDTAVARVALESAGKIASAPAMGLLQERMSGYEGTWLRAPLMTSVVQCDPSKLPRSWTGCS